MHLRESGYGKIHSFFFRIRIMAGVRSEDELGIKWDRCLADTGVKLLGGENFTTLHSVSKVEKTVFSCRIRHFLT